MKGEILNLEWTPYRAILTIKIDLNDSKDINRLLKWAKIGPVDITGYKLVHDKEDD